MKFLKYLKPGNQYYVDDILLREREGLMQRALRYLLFLVYVAVLSTVFVCTYYHFAKAGVIISGSVTQANVTKSLVSGMAFIDITTLGSELVTTNADFSLWAGDDPIDWPVTGEDANNYVTEHADGARLVSNNTAGVFFNRILTTIASTFYKLTVPITNYSAGDVRLLICDGILGVTEMSWGANGTYGHYFTSVDTTTNLVFYRSTGGNTDLVYSAVSVKSVTSPMTDYTSVDTAHSHKYEFRLIDSANKMIRGWIGANGGGEATSALANNITAISSADPGVVSSVAHDLSIGSLVYFFGLNEMTELNGTYKTVTAVGSADLFSIDDTGAYAAETTGGVCGEKVTDCNTNGVHILSTKTGSTQSFGYIDPAFDYNDATGYTWQILVGNATASWF